MFDFIGERDGTRTHDLLIKSQLLYRLSYALVTSKWRMILSENRHPTFRDHALGAGVGALVRPVKLVRPGNRRFSPVS